MLRSAPLRHSNHRGSPIRARTWLQNLEPGRPWPLPRNPGWPEPLAVSGIVVRGHLDAMHRTIHLDEATVILGSSDASAPSLHVTGNAEGLGGDVTIRGEMVLTALQIATLKRLWPVHVGSQA